MIQIPIDELNLLLSKIKAMSGREFDAIQRILDKKEYGDLNINLDIEMKIRSNRHSVILEIMRETESLIKDYSKSTNSALNSQENKNLVSNNHADGKVHNSSRDNEEYKTPDIHSQNKELIDKDYENDKKKADEWVAKTNLSEEVKE